MELAAKDEIVRETLWRAQKAELQAASLINIQQELAEAQQQLRTQRMLASDEVSALQGRLQDAAHSSKLVADVCQQRVQHLERESKVRSLSSHTTRCIRVFLLDVFCHRPKGVCNKIPFFTTRVSSMQATKLAATKLQLAVAEVKNQRAQLQAEKELADQILLAEQSRSKTLKAELDDNVKRWQQEIFLRLAAEDTCTKQQAELEEAKKAHEASVAAALAGAQAQEQLLHRLQQYGIRSRVCDSFKVLLFEI